MHSVKVPTHKMRVLLHFCHNSISQTSTILSIETISNKFSKQSTKESSISLAWLSSSSSQNTSLTKSCKNTRETCLITNHFLLSKYSSYSAELKSHYFSLVRIQSRYTCQAILHRMWSWRLWIHIWHIFTICRSRDQ